MKVAMWRGRRRRLIGGIVAVLLLVAAIAAVSWHYSNEIVVPDHSGEPYDIEVVAVGPETIELARTEETARPGIYGIEWPEGHAIIEEIVEPAAPTPEGGSTGRAGDKESTGLPGPAGDHEATGDASDTVTRRLRAVDGDLRPGEDVRIDSYVFRGDPRSARGLDYIEVEVVGELGAMPAWQIGPSSNPRWAIVVHGINSSRRVALPIAPTLRQAGLTTLAISYRDDIDSPPSPDGKHHMGLTEWRDVEAAADYALTSGARELLLIGHSMGGALVTQFLERSTLADRARAMILDAPALDWPATIAFGARQMGLPEIAAKPVQWMVGLRIDADWDQLDAIAHAEDLALPTLLFHGLEDRRVPIETSDAFAAALPDTVTYHRVPHAGHIQSWNVAPELYEDRLRRFVDIALP